VRPSGFEDVTRRLRKDHVLVIEGSTGSGRRAGAVALVREVTDGPVVILPRGVAMRDLVEWEYRWGCGYVVLNGEAPDNDAGSGWTGVADRVRQAGAHLVVTATAVTGRTAARTDPRLRWERPPAAEVLRGHLSGHWPAQDMDDLVSLLVTDLPPDFSLRRLADLARLLNEGKEPTEALEQLHEFSEQQIRQWFDQRRSRREMAEVTALAFLAGASEHTFESQLRRLEELLAAHEPLRLREPASRMDELTGDRTRYRLADEELMSIERPAPSTRTARVVGFKERGYQRFVISQLRETCDGRFWDVVREWINRMVLEDDRVEVASGLAWLAYTSFDEVRVSFLEPWSLSHFGWSGQVTAAYVLWCMCREASTATLALETAVQWSRSDDVDQRSTAMIAFSGELGVCYPTEAVRRLWQLTTQTDELCDAGYAALARLFAVLADQTEEAELLLEMIDRQWGQSCQTNEERRVRRQTVAATMAVLTVQSHRAGWPAIVEFLRARPDRSGVVARLWAAVLRSQRARREGLIALWRGLHALHDVGDRPAGDVRLLGRAISDALLGYERPLLRTDLARLDLELGRDRSEQSAAALDAFLEAFATRDDEDRPPYGSEL
jgi:hypothetical protein